MNAYSYGRMTARRLPRASAEVMRPVWSKLRSTAARAHQFRLKGKISMSLISRVKQRRFLPLVLALPVLFYLSVTLIWQWRDIYSITGDEPHYLLITDSLVRDHDVLVVNNYLIDTPVQRAIGLRLSDPATMAGHVHNEFSTHNLGLSFILTIPYSLDGVRGAKIFLALLAGLWPFLLYKVLFEITDSQLWSTIVAFALAVGLPFLAAANQVFPDLPGGMIVLWVTLKIFARLRGNSARPFSWTTSLWIGLLIGFLPWLHIRFSAPAIILLLAYLYVTFRELRPSRSVFQCLFPPALLVVSLISLGIYDHIAFANVLGPYEKASLSLEIKKVSMIFLGLHWDQSQGMFMQQPLFLLGLIGIAPLIKDTSRGGLLLAAVYLSILLPNAMHPIWYGGFSFLGRFGWTGVALWVFPMAFTVRFLLSRKRWLLALLCATSVLVQGCFAKEWVFQNGFLLGQRLHFWSSRSFYEGTRSLHRLPTFKNFDDYLKHPANYAFVLLGLLLLISGWLWQRGANRLLIRIWAASVVAGISLVLFVPPVIGSWTLPAVELPSKTGGAEGGWRVATEKDSADILMYESYVSLLVGVYRVTLEYESSPMGNGAAGGLEIIYWPERKVVADIELPPSEATRGIFTYELRVRESQSLKPPFEFRVKYMGHGSLKVKRLTITPISIYR